MSDKKSVWARVNHSDSSSEAARHVTTVQRMVSATAGSLVTSLIVTPLDVIKVRLQAQEAAMYKNPFSTAPTAPIARKSGRVLLGRTPVPTPTTTPTCTHFEFCNGLMDHMCAKQGCGFFVSSTAESTTAAAVGQFGQGDHGKLGVSLSAARRASVPLSAAATNDAAVAVAAQQQAARNTRKAPPVRFNGAFDTAVQLVRREGITSLWSGLPPTLVMAVPATMLYFTAYDELRTRMDDSPRFQQFLTSRGGSSDWIAPVAAGGLARTLAGTIVSPLELMRTQMQSVRGVKQRSKVVRKLLREAASSVSGFRSLWRGLFPTLLRDVPFSMLYWAGYEYNMRLLRSHTTLDLLASSFVAGAGSGMVAAMATTPWDVLKTRVQIDLYTPSNQGSGSSSTNSSTGSSSSSSGRGGGAASASSTAGKSSLLPPFSSPKTWNAAKSIMATEGWRGFFTGIVPRVAKVAPSCAIMISSYEIGKAYFRDRNQEQEQQEFED